MTAVLAGVLVFSAFAIGFTVGCLYKSSETPTEDKSTPVDEPQLDRLREEYSNFLSYDGSEQQ